MSTTASGRSTPSSHLSDSEDETKVNKSTKPSPTETFEKVLTDHVNGPATLKASSSTTDAVTDPKDLNYNLPSQIYKRAQATQPPHTQQAGAAAAANPHTSLSPTQKLDHVTKHPYLASSAGDRYILLNKYEILAAVDRAPPLPSSHAAQRRTSATFWHCGHEADGDLDELSCFLIIMIDFGVVLGIAYGIATLCLYIENGEEIRVVVNAVGSWLYAGVGGFWRTVFFVLKVPFVLLGWLLAPFGVLAGGNGARVAAAAANITDTEVSAIPTMADMQSNITNWSSLSPATHLDSSSSHTSILSNPTSPTGYQYQTSHDRGNRIWKIQGAYPFTRHNNSLLVVDRCEWLAKGFGTYWGEEMVEKPGKEEKDGGGASLRSAGGFDLELGNELARVLVERCAIPRCGEEGR